MPAWRDTAGVSRDPGSNPGAQRSADAPAVPSWGIGATVVTDLIVTRLARRDRREQTPIGLEIDERRAVEAIQPAHQQGASLHLHQIDDAAADRIGPGRRAQAERSACRSVIGRALPDQIAARQVQPIENFEALVLRDAVERGNPRRENLDATGRPIAAYLARTLQAIGPRRANENAGDDTYMR